MIGSILIALAVLAVPAAIVLLALVVLGSAVAGLADGAATGLVRPNPS